MKKLAILGSTGSIGTSTLSICESFPDRYQPIAFAAGRNLDVAFAQCQRWRPRAHLSRHRSNSPLTSAPASNKPQVLTQTEVLYGTAGTVAVATLPEVDFVVSAIVGVAGLEATYAAVLAGKTIGLANKECLVAAGDLILRAARATQRRTAARSTPNTTPSTRPCAAAPRRSQTDLAHRLRRPLPQHTPRRLRPHHTRSRPSSTPPGSWANASRSTPPP